MPPPVTDAMAQPHITLTTSAAESIDLENQASKAAKGKDRFKAVGTVVMAIKRFQASLNPTYSYGKKSPSGPATVREDRKRVSSRLPWGLGISHRFVVRG